MNIFRGQEYPTNFIFKDEFKDESVEIPELWVIGIAEAFIKDREGDPREDSDRLVWIEGSASRYGQKAYERLKDKDEL